MHFANETAENLISRYPELDVFVCASGISPSGQVHIGNFREVVTTYFVVKALREKGKKVRFIFSWDDYDRFRKVPVGVPEHFNAYIGMPYSQVPDPFGCHESYAEHFEAEFESTLAAFGIKPEYIYQSQMYQSGQYTAKIREALIHRHRIYDLLQSFKTQEWNQVARERYYPITVYCRACGKDHLLMLHYDEQNDILEYKCECGHHEIAELEGFNRIKLNWKIDWPMRWAFENVVFEPGGRDHSSENGSFMVSSALSRQILKFEPPHYVPYEFIGIKGNHAKMSSSSGHLITPETLLRIYPKEMILYMFASYHNTCAFDIGLDDEVIKRYTEFERILRKYKKGEDLSQDIKEALDFAEVSTSHLDEDPKFSLLTSLLPLLNFNKTLLRTLLCNDSGINLSNFDTKVAKAEYWLKNYSTNRLIEVRTQFNAIYYSKLTAQEKIWLKKFLELVGEMDPSSVDLNRLMQQIYDVVQHADDRLRKKMQKRFFEIVYEMILGQKSGPQIGLLILVVGQKEVEKLLSPRKYTYVGVCKGKVS